MQAPQAEMLSVWLTRAFTDLVDHLAAEQVRSAGGEA